MNTIFKVLDTAARLGVAGGLLLIGWEMHQANAPSTPAATASHAGYMVTADTPPPSEAKKGPATLSTIDSDLREINYTLSGVTVAIGQSAITCRR